MEARVQSIRQAALNDRPGGRRDSLLALIDAAKALGNQRIAREAQALAERIADKRFFVACLGQFKRGKSSLLNALIGSPVLPTGVVPVTAIVTLLRYGPVPHAEVHFENGSRQPISVGSLADYVSEQRNPANFRGVAAVEVFVPSALLETGMCFVDTPGVGSVYAGNTAVTKAFVPHVDAAMIVLGADPPISGEEIALLEEIASQVSEIVFVLNKADRLTDNERNEAIEFARQAASQRIGRAPSAIFQISAAEWLDGSGPSRDAPALMAALECLAQENAPRLVARAERRGIGRLCAALLREIDFQRNTLSAPLEKSRRIAERMREMIADAERSLSDLSHLFKAEQERVSRRCNERREAFLAAAIPAARHEFHEAIISAAGRRGSALHACATEIAQSISRDILNRWLEEERPAAEAMYRESGRRFVAMANDFLRRMVDSGDTLLADLPQAVSEESGFRVKGRPYFGDHFGFPRQSICERITNAFRSRRRQVEAIEVKVARYLDTLLSLNSTRILNDFDEIVRESGRRLEAEIRGMLKELRSTAESALARAEAARAAGASAVTNQLEHLQDLHERVTLISRLAEDADGAAR